jgi:hypothetical protein
MAWPWWVDGLGLHSFTSSSTFISTSTFIFSLVLPHSCSSIERERERNGRVKWVGAASAGTWYFLFMHMIGGAKGWVEDNSFPTQCMQFSYWWMIWYYIRLFYGLWTLGLDPITQDLKIRVTSIVPRVNNLTNDNLGYDNVLPNECAGYC